MFYIAPAPHLYYVCFLFLASFTVKRQHTVCSLLHFTFFHLTVSPGTHSCQFIEILFFPHPSNSWIVLRCLYTNVSTILPSMVEHIGSFHYFVIAKNIVMIDLAYVLLSYRRHIWFLIILVSVFSLDRFLLLNNLWELTASLAYHPHNQDEYLNYGQE